MYAFSIRTFEDLLEAEQQDHDISKNLLAGTKREETDSRNCSARWPDRANLRFAMDTMEVIEGNSRLAVYRIVTSTRGRMGDWDQIRCQRSYRS